MSDEVYEGAIGIDLGMHSSTRSGSSIIVCSLTNNQALPTLVLPTTKAPMLRSVRPVLQTFP